MLMHACINIYIPNIYIYTYKHVRIIPLYGRGGWKMGNLVMIMGKLVILMTAANRDVY